MTSDPALALAPGEVHAWKVRLPGSVDSLGDLADLLSPAERDRAARFASAPHQARFIASRASLRLLLARYTGIPARDLSIVAGPNGKPALEGAALPFNLSHSRSFAALAFCASGRIGVDIEAIDPAFPHKDVARDILTPAEVSRMAAMPADSQAAHFFRSWTLKEALLKAHGAGLSIGPAEIHLSDSEPPAILAAPAEIAGATLRTFEFHPGYAAAIALLDTGSAPVRLTLRAFQ